LRPALAVPAAALAAALVVSACGGDDGSAPGALTAEQSQQIAGVAALATNAYASAGPEALYDYLAADVAAKCPQEALAKALAGQDAPSAFRRLKAVESDGVRATATLVQAFGKDEREVRWVFVEQREGMWRLADAPGLERCAS